MRRNIDRSWSRWTRSLGEGGEHTVKSLASRHLPIPNRGIHLYGAEALLFSFSHWAQLFQLTNGHAPAPSGIIVKYKTGYLCHCHAQLKCCRVRSFSKMVKGIDWSKLLAGL